MITRPLGLAAGGAHTAGVGAKPGRMCPMCPWKPQCFDETMSIQAQAVSRTGRRTGSRRDRHRTRSSPGCWLLGECRIERVSGSIGSTSTRAQGWFAAGIGQHHIHVVAGGLCCLAVKREPNQPGRFLYSRHLAIPAPGKTHAEVAARSRLADRVPRALKRADMEYHSRAEALPYHPIGNMGLVVTINSPPH